MGGRIYDPELGRFTTPDPFVQHPLNSQSFNRYAYVYNNPLRYVDPSGFLPNNGPSALPGTQPEDVLAQDDACVSDPNTHCESFWTPDSVPTEPPEVEEQRRQATIAMSNQANMRFQGADFEQAKAPPQSNGRESQSKGNPGGDGLGPVIPRPGSGVRYAPLVELLPADAKTMLGKYFPNVNLDNVLIVVDPTMSRNRGTLAATTVASTLKGISIIRMRPGAYLYYGFNRAGVAEIGLGLRSGAGLSDRALGLGLLAHEIAHIAQVQLDLRKYGEEVGTALADVQYAFEDREAQGGWGPMEIGARAFGAMVARDVQAASGE
jgi:hypothetical protein